MGGTIISTALSTVETFGVQCKIFHTVNPPIISTGTHCIVDHGSQQLLVDEGSDDIATFFKHMGMVVMPTFNYHISNRYIHQKKGGKVIVLQVTCTQDC